jgi:hypothetical protein
MKKIPQPSTRRWFGLVPLLALFSILFAPGRMEAQGTLLGDGTFVNFDFEAANVPANQPQALPVSQALPGWIVYLGNTPAISVLPNEFSLAGAIVSILSPQWGGGPIFQGNYMVLIQAAEFPSSFTPATAAIAQTGQIPAGAKYLVFEAQTTGMDLTFDGKSLSLAGASPRGNYTLYEVNVASFAGQTGELRFTCPQANGTSWIYLDDLAFYSGSIPEPSPAAMLGLGAFILGSAWRKPRANPASPSHPPAS